MAKARPTQAWNQVPLWAPEIPVGMRQVAAWAPAGQTLCEHHQQTHYLAAMEERMGAAEPGWASSYLHGWPVLIWAMTLGRLDWVNQILKGAASPSVEELNRWRYPVSILGFKKEPLLGVLHQAAGMSPALALRLLRRGLDPNQRDSQNRTPLFWARGRQVVRHLLTAGALTGLRDNKGITAPEFWAGRPTVGVFRNSDHALMIHAWPDSQAQDAAHWQARGAALAEWSANIAVRERHRWGTLPVTPNAPLIGQVARHWLTPAPETGDQDQVIAAHTRRADLLGQLVQWNEDWHVLSDNGRPTGEGVVLAAMHVDLHRRPLQAESMTRIVRHLMEQDDPRAFLDAALTHWLTNPSERQELRHRWIKHLLGRHGRRAVGKLATTNLDDLAQERGRWLRWGIEREWQEITPTMSLVEIRQVLWTQRWGDLVVKLAVGKGNLAGQSWWPALLMLWDRTRFDQAMLHKVRNRLMGRGALMDWDEHGEWPHAQHLMLAWAGQASSATNAFFEEIFLRRSLATLPNPAQAPRRTRI